MEISLSNPFVIIIGGMLLLALIYLWNKRNTRNQRKRHQRSFKKSYEERRKERDTQ